MPLNGDLKQLGGHFLRAAQITPNYRLFARAEQAVPKPGLQRVRSGEGAADISAFGGWRAYAGSLTR